MKNPTVINFTVTSIHPPIHCHDRKRVNFQIFSCIIFKKFVPNQHDVFKKLFVIGFFKNTKNLSLLISPLIIKNET